VADNCRRQERIGRPFLFLLFRFFRRFQPHLIAMSAWRAVAARFGPACLPLVDRNTCLLQLSHVTIKRLREHLEMRPFHPMVVRTVSGVRHQIKHPDYLFIPPVGDTFLIVEPNGTMHHIGISYVEAVETQSKAGRSK
jgi:hypothetical protein